MEQVAIFSDKVPKQESLKTKADAEFERRLKQLQAEKEG